MFNKILIANRGEIACRIIKTCKLLGINTVAVYAEADALSRYVADADENAFIGAAPAKESFLKMEKIIAVARKYHCEAIHPGYGFLSENAEFAKMVQESGMVFIGPPVHAIAKLGDKVASKALAIESGVPVVPGHHEPLNDLETAAEVAVTVGFPLLLKPAAGGGGRGMRIVNRPEELESALHACIDETKKSFGDDRIFIERFVSKPRHIEFQIMADHYGNIVHLGERECSIQRRYQKVIEETPSVALTDDLRRQMGETACTIARAAGYSNAGTVEFILDENKDFFFLEMNTRLQVEHPITEMVTGLDLVELQLRIAAGEPLPLKQEDVKVKGWAIEARICAEDPYRGFLPTTGMITRYAVPKGEHIRVDSGIDSGSIITIYYDSLLAKVSAWGENRLSAINTLVRALNGYHIEGITTNVDFANAIINHPAFITGDMTTNFIDEHFQDGESRLAPSLEHLHLMAIAVAIIFHNRNMLVRAALKPMTPLVGSTPQPITEFHYVIKVEEEVFFVGLSGDKESRLWKFDVNGKHYTVITPELEYYRRRLRLRINGISHMFRLQSQGSHTKAFFCGIVRVFEVYTPTEWELMPYMKRAPKQVIDNQLRCPMPGLITALCVEEGAQVRRGQELIRMESMKMESGVASPCDGQVEKILVVPGQAVETDDVLITFKI